MLASSGASSTALERAKLEVEGLTASLTEAQEKYSEVERTNNDLLRQLEKWRSLDSRETAENEDLRKKKVELEVRVAELEAELEEVTKVTQARDEKLQAKLQRHKISLGQHVVSRYPF